MVRKISFFTSLLVDIVLSIFLVKDFKDFWIPIVLLIGGYLALIALYFIYCFIISLLVSNKKEYEEPSKFYRLFYDLMVEYLIEVGKIRLVKKGMEKLPVGEPFLIVCNHKSRYDPMIISQEIKNPRVLQISKPGNFKIPICGPVINRICYIPIDREDNRKAVKAINRAVNFMVNDGFSIGIAPEGHRYFGEGLDDFKPGAFKIAYKAKAPVVVCTFTNTEKVHKRFLFKRTEVDMHIVKTIPYEEYKDLSTRELAYNVRRLMVEDLNLGETEDESKLHII